MRSRRRSTPGWSPSAWPRPPEPWTAPCWSWPAPTSWTCGSPTRSGPRTGWRSGWSSSVRWSRRSEPVNLLSRGTTEVVMLHRRGSLGYAAGDGWRAVELPYRGGRLVMDVILPDEGRFDRFRDGLEVERLRELLGALDSREVRLALPRFDFDSDLDLRAPLQALGMRIAFTDAADFSGITDEAALRVDRVVQRAHVEIDERGTTAAAATGATMQLVSVVTPSRPIELRVDRPFLFAVRDRMTGALLFIGQVTNPAA